MSSPTNSYWTRRQFAGSLAAWLGHSAMARSQASSQRIKFGVFSLFEPRTILLEAEESLLLLLDNERYSLARELLRISYCQDQRIIVGIGTQTMTGSILNVASASGGDASFLLAVPPSVEHGSIRRKFRGSFQVSALHSYLQPVVSMESETAVASIVAAESPAGSPLSYLMAQSVATRSFLVAARHCHIHFDFCDTTHCQYLRDPVAAGSSASVAAARTEGQCLFFEGHPFAAMYSRSCSGRTNSLADLGLRVRDYPYYAVSCSFCSHHPEKWKRTLNEHVKPHDERERLDYNQVHGWSAIPSSTFTQTRTQLDGRGIGHGLGLCQRGAKVMAENGANFGDILAHYYPNTIIDP